MLPPPVRLQRLPAWAHVAAQEAARQLRLTSIDRAAVWAFLEALSPDERLSLRSAIDEIMCDEAD